MARKKIREFDAKKILFDKLDLGEYKGILVDESTDLDNLPDWVNETKLTVKPDQLFGKRGKHGLVLLNADLEQVKRFIQEHMNKEVTIGKAADKLTHFLIEPFVEHDKEYYLCIKSEREQDVIYFSDEGGINVEENWDKVNKITIPTLANIEETNLNIDTNLKTDNQNIKEFIKNLYNCFKELDFCYLELNPFTIVEGKILILDTVAQVDSCAFFTNKQEWNFPKPFGRKSSPEEEQIDKLDKNSGASLKLTILNPKGRIWNILSGGGASIIHLDTIANLREEEGEGEEGKGKEWANELANYGEYSGNPTTEESYQYAKTILDLMTREDHPEGKFLIIGGAIANFTDVKKTFAGIVQALKEYKDKLVQGRIKIYVRRGGPNYEKGLQLIEETGKELGVPIEIYGPETGMVEKIEGFIQNKKN